jgi:hypothetical protein
MADVLDQTSNDSTAAATSAASPPSASSASAGDHAGITAPPASAPREAFARLLKGEKPDAVNADLYKPKPGGSKSDAQPQPDPSKPDRQPAAQQGNQQQAAASKWPEGMDAKDQNVLKRAQMDPDTWAAIPPTNRTKILNNLRSSQAAADRAFGQGKQQGGNSNQRGAAGTDAGDQAGASTQTDDAHQDAATQGDGQQQEDGSQAGRQPATTTATKPAGQPATGPGLDGDPGDLLNLLTAEDRGTLEMLGGTELAETFGRGLAAVANHYQQQNAPMMNLLGYLLDTHITGKVNGFASDLAQQPGMESLRDGHADAATNRQALRDKALLLHRAGGGDAAGYSFEEALRDASGSLFRTNIQQSTQAQLLRGRQQSLRGAPDRGDGTRTTPRALNPSERAKAIFDQLRQGATPDAARLAVDGS